MTSNTMNSENSASKVVVFQDAPAMVNQGQLGTRAEATAIAEMPESTFNHGMAGRRSAEDYGKTRWLLTAEEESVLLCRYEILPLSGWSQASEDLRILGLEIVQKRDPEAIVGKDWIRNSLYKRHPESKLRWSQQLDRIRALRGSKESYEAIKLFFDNVCSRQQTASVPSPIVYVNGG